MILTLLVTATVLWNNDTFWTNPHPKPISFQMHDYSITAEMEDGSVMTTHRLSENGEIMKCEWGNAYWWVDMYGNVVYGETEYVYLLPGQWASSDIQAVSILVSKWNDK